jgi:hypothetical protein
MGRIEPGGWGGLSLSEGIEPGGRGRGLGDVAIIREFVDGIGMCG